MNKKELAEALYAEKKRIGANLTPVGRKTPLTKQEFVKRYVNGVGGVSGFKKSELEYLLEKAKKQKPIRSRIDGTTQQRKTNNKRK